MPVVAAVSTRTFSSSSRLVGEKSQDDSSKVAGRDATIFSSESPRERTLATTPTSEREKALCWAELSLRTVRAALSRTELELWFLLRTAGRD